MVATIVGTDVGNVNEQRQGSGFATVLQGDRAVDMATMDWQRQMTDIQRKDLQRQQKRDAAIQKIRSYAPEYFYKHSAEMKTQLNNLLDKHVQLVESGIDDPFTSTDPRAVEWQREYAKTDAMATASMQIKDQWGLLQKDVLNLKPDEYDANSLDAAVSFFDIPLSKIIETGASMPSLIKKAPDVDMMGVIGKNMTEWQRTIGEVPTNTEVYDFVTSLAAQPGNKEQFVRGYGSKLAQMDAAEKERIEKTAFANGREVWQQMAYEDALKWQKRREAFDLDKEFKNMAGLAEGGIEYSEWTTPDSFGMAPKKGSKEKSVEAAVNAAFNSDDRWMEVYNREGVLPRGKEETDGEYAKRVKGYMASELSKLVGTKTKSGRTERGESRKEEGAARSAFLEDVRSGDFRRIQGAANYLVGTRYAGNMTIQQATVTQGPNGYWLELDLGTNVSVKDVKESVADETGTISEATQVENRQGRSVVRIDLSQTGIENQTLVRLVDNAMKASGQPYDPRFTERTTPTTFEEYKSGQQSVGKKPAIADKYFQ